MSNIINDKLTTELFHDLESAERAYLHALDKGYTNNDINILMSEKTKNSYADSVLVKEDKTRATEGLGIGGAAGIALGGVVGALAALGTNLIIPGLGMVVAGPIAAGLAGAGAGGIAGGLVGTLIGFGIPEEHVTFYEKGLQSGGVVLGVNENNRNTNLKKDWELFKGIHRDMVNIMDVVGSKVENLQEEHLGTIETLMIDKQSGAVAYVVLNFGGFMNVGNKLFALPWKILSYNPKSRKLLLPMSKKELEESPGFDQEHWPNMNSVAWSQSIETHYKNYVI